MIPMRYVSLEIPYTQEWRTVLDWLSHLNQRHVVHSEGSPLEAQIKQAFDELPTTE